MKRSFAGPYRRHGIFHLNSRLVRLGFWSTPDLSILQGQTGINSFDRCAVACDCSGMEQENSDIRNFDRDNDGREEGGAAPIATGDY